MGKMLYLLVGVIMNKFSEKSRKVLRKFFLFFGVAAVSLVFQACYGMPMDDYYCLNEDCTCKDDCWDGNCECGDETSQNENKEDTEVS